MTLTDKLAALPPMPPEIAREGPYRIYKGGRYAVYDDGNSAETPYYRDQAEALHARNALLCDALAAVTDDYIVDVGAGAAAFPAVVEARAILAACEVKP